MKDGAWLTAKQALEWGFVDEITDDPEDSAPEITDVVADALAKEGIPMPPVDVKKGSFLERLAQFFTSTHSKTAAEAKVPEAAQLTPQMSKTLTAVAAILGDTVTVADGKLSITEDQADKLEAAVAAHDATVNDLCLALAMPFPQLSSLLFRMELDDYVVALPGGRYAIPAKS